MQRRVAIFVCTGGSNFCEKKKSGVLTGPRSNPDSAEPPPPECDIAYAGVEAAPT